MFCENFGIEILMEKNVIFDMEREAKLKALALIIEEASKVNQAHCEKIYVIYIL